jgi:phosphoglycolate phosphatase
MSRPLRYRAVLFDLDGTLVDSYEALEDAVNYALTSHDHPVLTPSRIREIVGEGVEVLMQRAFASTDVPRSAVRAFEEQYDRVCCEGSKVLDDVEATLTALAEMEVVMGVCTNKPTAFSRKILEFLGLGQHFRGIVGPDLAGARKPDRQHVVATLEAMGADAATALFVGDMPIDILAARNAGLDVAAIASGSSTREQLVAAAPNYLIERFSELVRVVQREAA